MYIVKINGKEFSRSADFPHAKDFAVASTITPRDRVTIERTDPPNGCPSKWLVSPGGMLIVLESRGPAAMEELFRF